MKNFFRQGSKLFGARPKNFQHNDEKDMDRPKSLRIVLCGNYGASNLGDEALLEGLIKILNHAFPGAFFTIMSARPEATLQHLRHLPDRGTSFDPNHFSAIAMIPSGIRSMLRSLCWWKHPHIAETLRAIKEADVFVLGGGGLFNDEEPRAIFIWALQASVALWYKKTLLCIGQSVGPLRKKWARAITARIMKKAQSLIVRDDRSAQLLHQLGLKKVEILPDLAFALTENFRPKSVRERFIVLSIRPWLRTSHHQQVNYQNLARFIDWLYEHRKIRTVMVPFQTFPAKVDDRQSFQTILQELRHPEAAEIHAVDHPQAAIDLMRKALAVVGMRLHSLIFATLTATPFLALSYSQKVKAFVRSAECENFEIPWSELSLKDLIDAFERLEKQWPKIQHKLEHKRDFFHHQLSTL